MKINRFLWLFFWGHAFYAQSFLQPGSFSYKVIHTIHQGHYRQADSLLRFQKTMHSPAAVDFLKTNYFWWMTVTSPQEAYLRDSLRKYIVSTEKQLPRHTRDKDEYYIRLMNYGFRFRLAFKEDRFLEGLKYAHKLSSEIQYAIDSVDKSPFLKLTAAIYLFSVDYGRQKYWIFYPYFLLIPQGDIRLGLKYLKELSVHSNEVIATEATYILMRIYKDLYKEPEKAYPLAQKLVRQYPDNFFYRAVYMQIKEQTGRDISEDVHQYEADIKRFPFQSIRRRDFLRDWKNIP